MTAVDARVFGRPRSPAVDVAILRAAVELCAEDGFEGTTVEAVANRAGVANATVYRRYPNRVGLVLAVATEVCRRIVDDVDTGSVLEDLRLVAHGIARNLEGDLASAVLAQIASGARSRAPRHATAVHCDASSGGHRGDTPRDRPRRAAT